MASRADAAIRKFRTVLLGAKYLAVQRIDEGEASVV